MRSVSRQQCHSARLLLGKPGKAACDWQLGRLNAYAFTYPIPYSSAAAAFLFRLLFRFFLGAAGGSSLIPDKISAMLLRFAASSTASPRQSLRVTEQNAARPASSKPPSSKIVVAMLPKA